MSGGSHNYVCYRIEEDLVGRMHDRELDDLMADVAKLAHAVEWMDSGDTCEETYLEEVAAFKKKWFADSRDERLRSYIDKAVYDLSAELYQMLGVENEQSRISPSEKGRSKEEQSMDTEPGTV